MDELLDHVQTDGLDKSIKHHVLDWVVTALHGSAPADGRSGRFVSLNADELSEAQAMLADDTYRNEIEHLYNEDGEDQLDHLPRSVKLYVECILPLP